jgi:hypothetical protein
MGAAFSAASAPSESQPLNLKMAAAGLMPIRNTVETKEQKEAREKEEKEQQAKLKKLGM